jgi:hypothetical protein
VRRFGLLAALSVVRRDSDLRGSSGGASSGGVCGVRGARTCGVAGCCLSVFRYSGVGSRVNGEFCRFPFSAPSLVICSSSLLDALDFFLACFSFSFESLLPIKSDWGGAGRAGTGFLPVLRGSAKGIAGKERSGGGSCLFGGLVVDPLLLSNFNSGNLILLALKTDRRFQISGLGGDDTKLAEGLARMCFGDCEQRRVSKHAHDSNIL